MPSKWPVLPVSCCSQHRIPVDVVGKITKSYFDSGAHDANAPQNQIPGNHSLHTKHMLNVRAYLCPGSVSLLLPFRQFAIFAALALNMLPESHCFKTLYGLLRTIGRISIHITTAIVLSQQLFKYPAVMDRGIRNSKTPDEFVLHINRDMVLVHIVVFAVLFGPAGFDADTILASII